MIALFALATAPLVAWSAVPGYVTDEAPPPSSVEDSKGLLGEAFAVPGDDKAAAARPTPDLWRDSTLLFRPRSYFFDRDRDTGSSDQAWALGGSLEFVSGWWHERLRFVSTLYTSQKLSAARDTDTTLLLQPDQDGITVLGQAYLETKLTEGMIARAGRTTLNLPYVNKNDSRMLPITHEAYGIGGAWNANLKIVAAHVRKLKQRNAENFIYMSEAAGAQGSKDPLTLFGVRLGAEAGWNVGAFNYYAWNIMNTLYAEGNISLALPGGVAFSASTQYTNQQSTGDELIGQFNTDMYGVRLSTSYRHAVLNLASSSTDDNSRIRSPFGGYPGYLSLMISDFNRAGEDAWLIGFSYVFESLGLPGLSTFVNYAQSDTPGQGTSASPDQQELDITVDYHFQAAAVDGLWLRLRWGQLDQHGVGANEITDTRIILNYEQRIF